MFQLLFVVSSARIYRPLPGLRSSLINDFLGFTSPGTCIRFLIGLSPPVVLLRLHSLGVTAHGISSPLQRSTCDCAEVSLSIAIVCHGLTIFTLWFPRLWSVSIYERDSSASGSIRLERKRRAAIQL